MDSVCHLCEKTFTQAGSLKRHRLTHTGEKSHKCKTCENAFTEAGSLKMHLVGSSKKLVVTELVPCQL